MSKLTKNKKLALAKIENGKVYTIEEAAQLVKEITFTKFDASVDIDVRLGVDPRKANQMVRGVVTLPHGTGKQVRVLVLCTPDAEAAAKEANVEPVSRPEADVVSSSLEEGVVLKVKVAVKPEITVKDYKGLKAVKTVQPVEESRVDGEIERMRQRNARIISREGKAEKGDTAKFDFEGFVDGVAFEGGKAENYTLELGSGQFIPGFEDQMIGHEAGEEFDVNVTFPEEYHAKELAGKEAVFKIKLHEVETKELPELDDEFAKDVSEYDTLDELKASIRKGMEEQADREAELNVENALVDQVIESMEGEIPQAMYDNRMDEIVNEYRYRLQQQGLQLEMYLQYLNQTMAQFRDSFKEQAEKQVKIRLALEAVAAAEGIVASDEDFDAEVKRIADQYKMEEDRVRAIVNEAEVKGDLAVNKAIDFLKQNAEITVETAAAEKAE